MASLRNLTLKTKLLLMMLSLLVLSISALFLHHLYDQQRLLSQLREYTEDLSTAIEVLQEQPVGEGDQQQVLKAFMEKLGQLGVRDVSITDTTEVQASTDPQKVGKGLVRRTKQSGPRQWVIRGVLGEESAHTRTTSTLTLPIVLGDRRVGYLLITRHLDDFSALAREAFVSRVAATLVVFGVGILVSLYLSWQVSRPLHRLTEAAGRVAKGDLGVQVPPEGGGEIGDLARTFNEMVARLREQRVLEERLHFAERSTALGRLASAVAHEIRNPLNFVSLSIDHVRSRLAPAEPQRAEEFDGILGNMKAEISRLNRLVGEFLSFGKPMRLHPQECAVEVLLREVGALVDHKARDQGIVLAVQAAAPLPRIVADPELLKTCFLNLMINALDAMPEGGALSASVRSERGPAGDVLLVEVTDTGRGMSEDEVRDAFEPYFSTKETGLGLGLALTRKIVGDHGGSVELSSVPGQGTSARLRFPVPRATALAS
jgi:signal transduction histidine kinase